MLDTSSEWYNAVRKAIKSVCKYSGRIDTDTPPSLPYMVFELLDNPTNTARSESENPEYSTIPVVQIKVYTNGSDTYADNMEIMELANDKMVGLGFIRTFGPQQVKNVLDTSVLCFVAKYRGVLDADGTVYNS